MLKAHIKLFIQKTFSVEEETIEWLEVASSCGEFLILPNHAPLISTVSDGESIKYKVVGGEIKTQSTTKAVIRVEKEGIIYLIC